MNADPLFIAAAASRNKAFAPFSGFKVGAAVQATDGIVYSGCNIECASYGLTICAERVAIFKAISEGTRKIARVAVFAETEELTPPCGACRQVLWELCNNPDVEIYLLNHKKQMVCYKLADLLPLPFEAKLLTKTNSGTRPGI
jgi:cytidine deaminase